MRLLALAAILFALSPLTRADEPDVRGAVERAIVYLEEDGVGWKQDRKCASCHHVPMAVWGLNEARKRGYKVSPEPLSELTAWVVDKKDPGKIVPQRKETKDKFVNLPALIMALGIESGETKTTEIREGLHKMLISLPADQREDGSWGSDTLRPPFGASAEVITSLAVLALTDAGAAADNDTKSAASKGVKWLESTKPTDEEVQAIALRLLVRKRIGASPDALKPIIKQLLGRQNQDGGWSQTKEMASDAFATGQALHSLTQTGMDGKSPEVKKAQAFLVKTQSEDGSWPMKSRPMKPGGDGAKNLEPITFAGSAWGLIGLVSTSPDSSLSAGKVAGTSN